MKRQPIRTEICLVEDLPENVLSELKASPDQILICDNKILTLLEGRAISLPDEPAGREIAYMLSRKQRFSTAIPQNPSELYERILLDAAYQPDVSLLQRLGIRLNNRRCVTVFRSESPLDRDLISLLYTMTPIEEIDSVVPLDYQSAALVRDLEGQSDSELIEFIEAVAGTMETEGIAGICAGIGGSCVSLESLRLSLNQALQAIKLGKKYHRRKHVFVYEQQTIEMIVDEIPPVKQAELKRQVFGEGGDRKLSDEMLDTVRVFFDNDLNLTAASKQLYIHRNTLNYRLDKIKKAFGLDLRSFRDAVIFKIISEMNDEPSA